MAVLDNIQPIQVFRFFEEICAIPHGSADTDKISNYLVNFAKDRGLKSIQDEFGNVIIFKDGTEGYENSESLMIQGHMDMVCEKNSGSDLNFSKDGLKLKVEGNVISAEGTTLGGDDGIAVAFALAILDSKDGSIPHPPLEAIFTVDEEIGMLGAAGIDCSMLKSKRMLNLDSDEEGKLLVSCAGGVTAVCHIPVEYDNNQCELDKGIIKTIKIKGITGGHSGEEIIKQGANSNKVLGRVLFRINKNLEIKLIDINGGLKDNAIPRESSAVILLEDGSKESELLDTITELNTILQNEYKITDENICVCVEDPRVDVISGMKGDRSVCCMTRVSTDRVISTLCILPNGVQRMSSDIDGLVQTSLNLGIMKTVTTEQCNKGEVTFSFSVRSSVGSEKDELTERLECISEMAGGYFTSSGKYPAWEYRTESMLRELMIDVYEKMFEAAPEIHAIHAGVECGLFAGKIDDLDCVSYGPRIDNIHTTSECLYIDSVERTWKYTLEILKMLK